VGPNQDIKRGQAGLTKSQIGLAVDIDRRGAAVVGQIGGGFIGCRDAGRVG